MSKSTKLEKGVDMKKDDKKKKPINVRDLKLSNDGGAGTGKGAAERHDRFVSQPEDLIITGPEWKDAHK